MDVMVADLTRSCSALRPQAHENTDSTFIFIPTDLSFKGMPVGKRESTHWEGCAKVFRGASRLSESKMDHSLQTSHC